MTDHPEAQIFKFQLDITGTRILAHRKNKVDMIQFKGKMAEAIAESIGITPGGKVFWVALFEVGLSHDTTTVNLYEKVPDRDW